MKNLFFVFVVVIFMISCSDEEQFRGYIPVGENPEVIFLPVGVSAFYEIKHTINVVVGNDTINCEYVESCGLDGGFLLSHKEINPVSKDKKVYVLGNKRSDGTNYIVMVSLEPY